MDMIGNWFLSTAKNLPKCNASQSQETKCRPVGESEAEEYPVFDCAKARNHEHGGPFHGEPIDDGFNQIGIADTAFGDLLRGELHPALFGRRSHAPKRGKSGQDTPEKCGQRL